MAARSAESPRKPGASRGWSYWFLGGLLLFKLAIVLVFFVGGGLFASYIWNKEVEKLDDRRPGQQDRRLRQPQEGQPARR